MRTTNQTSRRCSIVIVLSVLVGCDTPPSFGSDASADRVALETRDPDRWVQACEGRPASCEGRLEACPSEADCRVLTTGTLDERERMALALNGRLSPRLVALHFARGRRQALAVSDLLSGRGETRDVADANRSFVEGVDRGVLTPWTETLACGVEAGLPGALLPGPVGHPCTALDNACSRGRLDATRCCTAEHLLRGTPCGDGGRCDGGGACLASDEVEEAPGTSGWLSIFPDGYPVGALVARRVGEVLPVISPPELLPAGSLEIRPGLDLGAYERGEIDRGVEITGAAEPTPDPSADAEGAPEIAEPVDAPVLAIIPPEMARRSLLTVLRSAEDAPLHLVAFDGPPGLRALVLHAADESIDSVLVVRGRLDELPTVFSDGSSEGTIAVRCDSVPVEGVRCDRVGPELVVVGDSVALAWLPPPSTLPVTDVLVGGVGSEAGGGRLVPGRAFAIAAAAPPCSPQTCTLPSGCPGYRLCTDGTILGACVPYTSDSSCDGVDQDCDGTLDENAASSCSDGIGCTIDGCNTITHTCFNIPAPTLCTADTTSCTIGICTSATGVMSATRSFSATDPIVVPSGVTIPTGCTYRAGHSWCTNTFDSCNCNGPEVCTAGARTGAPPAGCSSAPVAAAGIVYAACDTDGAACTVERACCEPTDGGYCRVDSLQSASYPAAYNARLQACAQPGGITDTWPAVPGFPTSVTGTVRCSPVNPLGAPYTDRCQNDGNPCTTTTCSPSTGACTPGVRPGTGPSEPYVDPATGAAVSSASCAGFAPGTSMCSTMSCFGTPTCHPIPRPSGITTPECGVGTPLDAEHCGAPLCVAGLCNAGADLTPPSGSLGACPTSFPAPCVGPSTCGGSIPPSPEWPDLPDGCRPPAGFCYLGLPSLGNNGRLDGVCIPQGSTANPCAICDPNVNPFDRTLRPEGTSCPAACSGASCSCYSGACSASGTCITTCHPERAGCASVCALM